MHETPKHLAFFLGYLGGGGAERVMLNLARGSGEHGLDVDIILSQSSGPSSAHLWKLPANVRVVDLQASNRFLSLLKLAQYLRKERPQILLSALHFTNEIAILAKRLAGVPTRVIVSEHNNLSQIIHRQRQSLRYRLVPTTIKFLYPWADGIVAVSKGVAISLAEVGKLPCDRIKVIYNPVITPEIAERAQEPLDHPWFQPGEPPVIVGVGKLEAQKDFATLIRAFSQIKRVKQVRLVILGWGPDLPQLDALIQELDLTDDVALLGYQNNPYPYMARASVFVLSSAWEGFGNVLVEAMAVNTPVVSTNCESGPAEILNHGQYGHLAPVGDSTAIAQAVLRVLNQDIKSVSPAWLNQFTLKSVTQEYLNFFHTCQRGEQTEQHQTRHEELCCRRADHNEFL